MRKICVSCGMPMEKAADFPLGEGPDGAPSRVARPIVTPFAFGPDIG